MTGKRFMGQIALATALVTLAGCGGATPESDGPRLTEVRYSAFKVPDPAYIAVQKGFFEKRGIKVSLVENPGGTTGLQAVAAGRTDVGGAPIAALASAVGAKLPVIGVADFQSALPGSPIEEFFVRAGGGVAKVADLKGHKVAVNSVGGSFQQTIIIALEQAGLRASDVEFTVIPFDKQAAALVSGSVDLIGLVPPHSGKAAAVFAGKVTKLFDALSVLGAKQFVLFAVNTKWAAENPDAVRAWVGGIADAAEWMGANGDEADSLLAEYVGVEREYMPAFKFQPRARVQEADVSYWIDYMRRHGDLRNPVTAADVATNKYNPFG